MRYFSEKVNWYGTFVLSLREIKRFLRVYHQTVLGPVFNGLVFLLIFFYVINSDQPTDKVSTTIEFIGYGIIMMSIIQNAFANSSSSFIMYKVIGYINDILTPPFGSLEIIIAFIIGSIVRAVIVGCAVAVALSFFINYHVQHWSYLVIFVLSSSVFLGQLGLLSGLVSKTFEHNFAFSNYLIMPFSFLSGTFYSVKSLPLVFQKFNLYNPFFYMISGFRYSLTDDLEFDLVWGISYLTFINISLFIILNIAIDRGWRIKE